MHSSTRSPKGVAAPHMPRQQLTDDDSREVHPHSEQARLRGLSGLRRAQERITLKAASPSQRAAHPGLRLPHLGRIPCPVA